MLLLPACGPVSPPTSSHQGTYILRGGYTAGQRVVLTLEAKVREQKQARPSPDEWYVYRMDVPVEFSKPNDAGRFNATMTLRRLAIQRERGGSVVSDIDSDRPETAGDGDMVELFPLLAVRFHVVLAGGASVESVLMDRESLASLERSYFADLSPEARTEVVAEASACAAALLENPWAYLPYEPVAVGDRWGVEGRTYAAASLLNVSLGYGPVDVVREVVRCTLEEVRHTEHGRIATIDIFGRWEMPEHVRREQEIFTTGVGGTIRFNLDTGELLEHVIRAATVGKNSTTHDTITTTLSKP